MRSFECEGTLRQRTPACRTAVPAGERDSNSRPIMRGDPANNPVSAALQCGATTKTASLSGVSAGITSTAADDRLGAPSTGVGRRIAEAAQAGRAGTDRPAAWPGYASVWWLRSRTRGRDSGNHQQVFDTVMCCAVVGALGVGWRHRPRRRH